MNIAINAVLYHDKPRGVGSYFDTLMEEIALLDESNKYFIFYGKWMDYEFVKIKKANIKLVPLKIPRNKYLRNIYLIFIFPFIIKKYHPDLLHNIDSTPVVFKTCPIVSTIHDISEFYQKDKYGRFRSFVRRTYVKNEACKSDTVITVSEFSKESICSKLHLKEDKVRVIYNSFKCPSNNTTTHLKRHDVILFVGELEKTKNVEVIIKALSLIEKRFVLVLSGKFGNDYPSLTKLAKEYNVEDRVVFKGYVSKDELENLYDSSFAFVFPSKFEGFGIPIIEAMSHGLPVISSNSTCLPEVGGDAAIYFSPDDFVKLAEGIESLINDENLYFEMVEKGKKRMALFSPQKMAEQTLNVYEQFKN
jgi:glycosyltransferase involved in cell wall biosynthesis